MLKRFILLYGPPASGKSSIGQLLARSLDCPFYDLDEEIELQSAKTIPELFVDEGEIGFRVRETQTLHNILNRSAGVLALGGGALLRSKNRQVAEANGEIVCLSATFDTIIRRLGESHGGRPLLEGDAQDRLRRLLLNREEHYASFPYRIVTDGVLMDTVVHRIQAEFGIFRIQNMGDGYDVCVKEAGLSNLGSTIQTYDLHGQLALVTDDHVAQYHLNTALDSLRLSGLVVEPNVLPAGEETKTLHTIQLLLEKFALAGLDRSSTAISLGGGVINDLAGFAAAIYMRGIRWVTIPTSLLAMVDASLGGKTGVDLPQGKNLAGAFHPPQLVFIDPQLLSTLSEIELRNGLAEVIKHAILADPELFGRCQAGWDAIMPDLDWITRRALSIKINVIEEDPFEKGRRASLNLGHTLGHGLELATDFRLKHGEAVAIGMVAAARLAEKRGVAQTGLSTQIEACLQGVGLPTSIPEDIERARLIKAMALDKKRRFGCPKIVLPVAIGDVRWGVEIDDLADLIDVMG